MALKLNKFYHIIYLVVKDCNRGIIAFLSHLDHIAKTEMDIWTFCYFIMLLLRCIWSIKAF